MSYLFISFVWGIERESFCRTKALNTSLSYEILKIVRFKYHKSTPIMNMLINLQLTHETLVDLWHFESAASFRIWPFPAWKTPIPAKSQSRQNGFLSCCSNISPVPFSAWHPFFLRFRQHSFCSLAIPNSRHAHASSRCCYCFFADNQIIGLDSDRCYKRIS